jgi:lysophospholipase L1-like esterase
VQRLRVPWGPLLTQEEAQRGLAYYGSGQRLQAVVNKLMAGKPIKVFTLGASVTRGIGTTDRKHSYANRLFEYIAHAFPHKGHVFINRGIGGTSSSIYSVCAEHMVHKDADLVVLEFSANDKKDAPYTDPERRGYEQLVRKLLQLPGRPALIQLHHYAWWHAVGDGVNDGGLFYHPAGEAQLGTFASYYDFPAVSVRAAMWHLMRAGVAQFKPDAVRKGADKSPTDVAIPGAPPGTEEDYWYKDRTHPADEGHGMLAELLAHVLARAVVDTLAPRPVLHLPGRTADLSPAQDEHGLPLPMVPGNAATPTSLCAIEVSRRRTAAAGLIPDAWCIHSRTQTSAHHLSLPAHYHVHLLCAPPALAQRLGCLQASSLPSPLNSLPIYCTLPHLDRRTSRAPWWPTRAGSTRRSAPTPKTL